RVVDPEFRQFVYQGNDCRRIGVLGPQSQYRRHVGRGILFQTRVVSTCRTARSPERQLFRVFQLRGDGGSRYRLSTAEPRGRGRAFSCRELFWGLPRRRECRLFEFVRLPHCLHRCVYAGYRFGSAVADFPFQYEQWISLQCTGGALSEFRSLQSEYSIECDLHHDYADGTGPDSAHAKFLYFGRGAATGKYAPVLVVRERGRGFAAARDWVSHRSSGGQVRSCAFACDAAAMAGMVVSSRTYAAGYVLHRAGQSG